MGLREILGAPGAPVSWDTARAYLKSTCVDNDVEVKRRADALKRDEYYEGRGEPYMKKMLARLFTSEFVRKLREEVLSESKWDNVIARVVNEIATVYSETPVRSLASTATGKRFFDLVGQDAAMSALDVKLELHEDVWVQYRVRLLPDGTREPVIDVVSPSLFWAVPYPQDQTALAAVLLEQTPAGNARAEEPHYRLWTYDETLLLDKELRLIRGEKWPLGRMPGFIATLRRPSTKGRILALSPCADLVAAHEAVWFQNTTLFKESKSATKQTAYTGDMSATPMGQPSDTEADLHLGEGVTATTLDRGMDQSQFRDNADHIRGRAGANHGLPPSVMDHRDASSGSEIHLRRIPLRELRKKRIPILRAAERTLAEIQEAVNAVDLPEYPISAAGSSVDYGEIQQPLTKMEELQVYETERRLVLSDPIAQERERNPDLRSDAEAWSAITKRVVNQLTLLEMTQEMSRLNGSASSKPGDKTPEQNGDDGKAASDGEEDDDEEEEAVA
jgi:hypothetical protein